MSSLRFFITTTVVTIFLILFLGGAARQWGLSQEYSPHHHPLLQNVALPWVIAEPQWVLAQTPERLAKFCKERPALFLSLDLYLQADGQWTTSIQPGSQSAESLLKTLGPQCHWWLNIQSNVLDVHTKFLAWMKQLHLENQYAVHSPYDVIVASLKEIDPQALFVASHRETTRLSIAEQLSLEPVVTLNSDIIKLNPYHNKRWVLQESLITEVHRRKKLACVGPLSDIAKWKQLRDLNFDCVLTADPLNLL